MSKNRYYFLYYRGAIMLSITCNFMVFSLRIVLQFCAILRNFETSFSSKVIFRESLDFFKM